MLGATVAQRSCPSGCGRTVRDGQLLCPGCWHEVPKHLQNEVYRTWRRWRRDISNNDRRRAYREARDEAIGSVP